MKYKGYTVKINHEITLPQPWLNGKPQPAKPVIDKEGHWVQVEFVEGPDAGTCVPATKEELIP